MISKHLFQIPELALEALEHCVVAQLGALATMCHYMAGLGERHMSRGWKKLLKNNGEPHDTAKIDTDQAKRIFIHALGDDGSVIVGSFT